MKQSNSLFPMTRMQSRALRIFSVLLLLFLNSGCLPEASKLEDKSSLLTDTEFSGIAQVTNLNGPLKIEWLPAKTEVKGYNVYHQKPDGDYESVGNVGPTDTYFIHGTAATSTQTFNGKIHTYRVRAIDINGVEETNNKTKSQISYSGLVSASTISRTSVQILLPTTSPSFDEVRIYGSTSFLNESPTLMSTSNADETSVVINNLKPGLTYVFYAQAYSSYLDKEDGNTVFASAQTFSDTSVGYLGVFNVQAYGPAPNAPDFQPKTELAILSWVNFSNGGSGSKYRVIRSPKDAFINTNPRLSNGTIAYCTKTSTSSCVVQDCQEVNHTVDGTIGPSCQDTQVASAPAVYDYAIVLIKGAGTSAYAEEVPTGNQDAYRIRVSIPPKNMALVQRDAVNFEMCQLLHSSNVPTEKQRCPFTGYGSVPLNSGPGKDSLGLSPNFYDFGYNLFVDRWELGCDYDDVFIGNTSLAADVATYEGRVVMTPSNVASAPWTAPGGAAFPSTCRLSRNSKWYGVFSTTTTTGPNSYFRNFQEILSDPQVKKLFTNDPVTRSGKKTVAHGFETTQAWDACQTQEDPSFGKKRLPRMREFRAYAAFPWIPGEVRASGAGLAPYYLNSAQMTSKLYTSSAGSVGGSSFETRGCGTYGSTSVTNGDSPVPLTSADLVTDLSDRASKVRWPSAQVVGGWPALYAYGYIGSNPTSGCLTRFGIQDTVGNQKEYVSDKLGECNPRPISNLYRSPTIAYNQCFNNGVDPQRCVGYTLDFAKETATTWTSATTGYRCSLVTPNVPGNCPAANLTLPAAYVKYCTGSGGGLDSGNVDLSPYSINPMLPPYSYRVTNTTKIYNSLTIKDKAALGPYFNPTLGIPSYESGVAYTYTPAFGSTTDFTKSFSATPGDLTLVDYISNATVSGSSPVSLVGASETIVLGSRGYSQEFEYNGTTNGYARRIAVGGAQEGGITGRWHTTIEYNTSPSANYWPEWGARCVLPAE